MKRVITSIIGLPILFGIIWYLPEVFTALLIGIVAIIMLREYFILMQKNNIRSYRLPSYGMLITLIVIFYANIHLLGILFFIIPGGILMYALVQREEFGKIIVQASLTMLGILYIGIMSGYLILLRNNDYNSISGKELLVFLITVIWLTDTGAYYTGRLFGRHALSPNISPKKTVEGAIGGIIFALAGGIILCTVFKNFIGYAECIFITFILSIIGQIGDLVESLIKRSFNSKDAGSILPGHGGLMDRMDGLIFAAPFMYLYIYVKALMNSL